MVIGLGSLLFHTTAIELTKWADILPIATFTLALALFCLRRFARLSWSRAIAYFLIFFASISVITYFLPPWLTQATNGTTAYLPALAGFLFFGLVALVRGSRAGWYAISCAVILCLAFFFRAVDQAVCGCVPARHAFPVAHADSRHAGRHADGGREIRTPGARGNQLPVKPGSIPDEGDLLQRLLVEDLDAFGDVAAAGAVVEGERAGVLLQRPDDQALQARGRRACGAPRRTAGVPRPMP